MIDIPVIATCTEKNFNLDNIKKYNAVAATYNRTPTHIRQFVIRLLSMVGKFPFKAPALIAVPQRACANASKPAIKGNIK